MGLERDLHDLLYEHDCVIVPGWGGFLAQYKPARLDVARRVIHPPSKDVGFNRHLLRNDGLLNHHLAERDGLTFTAANEVLGNEVAHWRSELDRTGRLELPRIGIFYRDSERNLQFDPDDRANFLKEAFGLRPVPAVEVVRAAPEPVPVLPLRPVVLEPSRGPRWNWAAAAGIALLLTAGVAGILYSMQDNGGTAFADLLKRPTPTYAPATPSEPLKTTQASVFSLPDEPLGIKTLPLTENDSVTLTVDLGSPVEVAPAETTMVSVPERATTLGRFHIIGGCFAQPENADRLLSDLLGKGYAAHRLAQYGELHPVAFGSYPDRASALEALASIRNEGSAQAWLLVR